MKIHYPMGGTILLIQSMTCYLLLTQLWMNCLPLEYFLTGLEGIFGVWIDYWALQFGQHEKKTVLKYILGSKIDNQWFWNNYSDVVPEFLTVVLNWNKVSLH